MSTYWMYAIAFAKDVNGNPDPAHWRFSDRFEIEAETIEDAQEKGLKRSLEIFDPKTHVKHEVNIVTSSV